MSAKWPDDWDGKCYGVMSDAYSEGNVWCELELGHEGQHKSPRAGRSWDYLSVELQPIIQTQRIHIAALEARLAKADKVCEMLGEDIDEASASVRFKNFVPRADLEARLALVTAERNDYRLALEGVLSKHSWSNPPFETQQQMADIAKQALNSTKAG